MWNVTVRDNLETSQFTNVDVFWPIFYKIVYTKFHNFYKYALGLYYIVAYVQKFVFDNRCRIFFLQFNYIALDTSSERKILHEYLDKK